MCLEKSCGAVVFSRGPEGLRYVLVRSLGGEFGFPKGHMEDGEEEVQTALREIREEVNLSVRILPGFRAISEYVLPNKDGVKKQVVFFLAEYSDQEIKHQKEELLSGGLFSYEVALTCLNHENNKQILKKANAFLEK